MPPYEAGCNDALRLDGAGEVRSRTAGIDPMTRMRQMMHQLERVHTQLELC